MAKSLRTELKKRARRYLAHPRLQRPFYFLYRVALLGMNYGGAGSSHSAGDELALRRVAARVRGRAAVVFDVGANVGTYAHQVLDILGDGVTLYAFEPSAAAFARLREEVGGRANVHLIRAGIGATRGQTTLWSEAPGSVLASTFANPVNPDVTGETIDLVTIDDVCTEHAVGVIDLLKLDLEGGELDALRGARRMLASGAIEMIQFEFGQPSLAARTYFVDLFSMLHPQYELYRVLPNGLERLGGYHETLEVFMSTNYLAIKSPR